MNYKKGNKICFYERHAREFFSRVCKAGVSAMKALSFFFPSYRTPVHWKKLTVVRIGFSIFHRKILNNEEWS